MPPKKAAKPKKRTIQDAEKELTDALERVVSLESQIEVTRTKLSALSVKLLETASATDLEQFNLPKEVEPLGVPAEVLVYMVSRLVARRSKSLQEKLEQRAEELETRCSQQASQIADLLKLTLAYEYGLEDVGHCGNIYAVRQKIRQLQMDLSQSELEPALANEAVNLCLPLISRAETVLSPSQLQPDEREHSQQQLRPLSPMVDYVSKRTWRDQDESSKYSGETHVSELATEIQNLIANELSVEKSSGADWRLFAEKVGISREQISAWRTDRPSCPMLLVLAEWGRSSGATVRMLYRHLMSPQLRYIVAGKLIGDLYCI